MHMYNTSYILVCHEDRSFTSLNRFLPKQNIFEGEYSLLHNTYSYDEYFLARFLIAHLGHPVVLLNSESEQYHAVIHHFERFQGDDIPRYIEEKQQADRERQQELETKRSLGQLQLLIAKQMIQREWELVQNQAATSEQETYVLLGKDYAFRKSVMTINEVAEQGGW